MKLFRFLILIALTASPAAYAITFTVTSAADSGPGSLREAILLSNAAPSEWNGITVSLPEGSVIHLTSELPPLRGVASLDGGGATLDGTDAGNASGLILEGGAAVMNLRIVRFARHGVEVRNSSQGAVVECVIGEDAPGAEGDGILVQRSNRVWISKNRIENSGRGIVMIGGAAHHLEGNVVSNSRGDGIALIATRRSTVGSNDCRVPGCGYVGPNVAESNGGHGFAVVGDTNQFVNNIARNNGGNGFNIRGNDNAIFRGTISGNVASGIEILGRGNKLEQNEFTNNLPIEVHPGAAPIAPRILSASAATGTEGAWAEVEVTGDPHTRYVLRGFAASGCESGVVVSGASTDFSSTVTTDQHGRGVGAIAVDNGVPAAYVIAPDGSTSEISNCTATTPTSIASGGSVAVIERVSAAGDVVAYRGTVKSTSNVPEQFSLFFKELSGNVVHSELISPKCTSILGLYNGSISCGFIAPGEVVPFTVVFHMNGLTALSARFALNPGAWAGTPSGENWLHVSGLVAEGNSVPVDLEVIAQPSVVWDGGKARARVVVRNNGSSVATKVMLLLSLPEGVKPWANGYHHSYDRTIDRDKTCQNGGGGCQLGSIPPGESKVVFVPLGFERNFRGAVTLEAVSNGIEQTTTNNVAVVRIEPTRARPVTPPPATVPSVVRIPVHNRDYNLPR